MRFIIPLLLAASPLSAAVIYSGSQNLTVAWNHLEGIYVNLATSETSTAWPADFDESPWINITLGGYGIFNSELVNPVTTSGDGSYDPVLTSDYYLNLAAGAMLDSSTEFTDDAFASENHVGTGNFVPLTSGFVGFSFQLEEGGETYYGWLRLTVDGTSSGTVVDWAYEDTAGVGIEVGAVPEPSAGMAVAVAAGGLAMFRRRRGGMGMTGA